MNKGIRMVLASGKACRLIAGILLVLAGKLVAAHAQTLTTLYSFPDPIPIAHPALAGLVQGSDGNFYGTTQYGGTSNLGTVFRIGLDGSYTNLHSFVGAPSDGDHPMVGLVQGTDGWFYGTALFGGSSTNWPAGTVFRISPSGDYTNLYSFNGGSNDGAQPSALVQGSDGNFYGTTPYGGTNGVGTVFRISPSGNYTNLCSLPGPVYYGPLPAAGLVQGGDGNFYGTTYGGGANGLGSVFRISPGGTYTTLYSFVGYPTDLPQPSTALVRGSDGNLYGTSFYGVYRITPSGSYKLLCFLTDSPANNNVGTFAGLVQGSDGNFYGTTLGGTNMFGGIVRISPDGTLTNLYSFTTPPDDGATPYAGLVQGSDGNFYGTTTMDGRHDVNYAAVYRFSIPLNPPANQVSAFQIAGNDVAISVPSVAGETYQLQFTADLTSGIWSNVPAVSITNSIGALLTVTNPGGAIGPQGFYRFAITP